MLNVATPELADDDRAALWQRWQEKRDPKDRDALALRYAPWARRIARDVFMRCRARSSEWPDYVQNASVGLLEALDGFDEQRGVPFEGYARLRVRGAVFNGLRDLMTHSASPARLGLDRERVDSLLDDDSGDPVEALIAVVSGLATGYLLGSSAKPEAPQGPATPYDEAVRSQLGTTMTTMMSRLPARERDVLTLHYLNHMAFSQVADALGVTKGRISQLHRQALGRLRSFMLERHFVQDF